MKLLQTEINRIMSDAGAVIENDHLVLTSGRHSEGYADVAPFWERPELAPKFDLLCGELAGLLYERADIDVVLGPQTGGGKIASVTARRLNEMDSRRTIVDMTAMKVPGAKKQFTVEPEDRARLRRASVAIVDDVLMTGGSLDPTISLVRDCGGVVVVVGVFVNRSKLTIRSLGVLHLVSLRDMDIPSWSEEECKEIGPCSRGASINEQIGHGRAYMDRIRAANV